MKITGYTYHKKENGFDALRFVLKALSDDASCHVLTHLCVRNGQFIATDGRRLHVAEAVEKHAAGLYAVLANTAKLIVLSKCVDDLKFPNTEQAIPTSFDNSVNGESPEMIQHRMTKAGGGCLSHDYLADAMPDKKEAAIVEFTDELSPVKIINGVGFAVIMPIQDTNI